MKAVIVGGRGQLGHALVETAPPSAQVLACDLDELDITDAAAVEDFVGREKPELIFNAAAYTAVDKAESDEAAAHRVNAEAVGYLAAAASRCGAKLIHVSTDFVFDGASGRPYKPSDNPSPLNAYGRTKLAGEAAAGPDALIVRTAWVYGPVGGNFVRTMLRLMGEHPQVRVVCDQVGTPTYAPALAQALWTLAGKGVFGLHHYTDAGVASWYDFAVAIQEEALAAGLLSKAVPVIPIPSRDFPTPATRPSFGVLDKSETYAVLGARAPHWRVNLRKMIERLNGHG